METSGGLKSYLQLKAGLNSKSDEVAQGPVQSRSQSLQGQRFYSLSGPLLQCSVTLTVKVGFLIISLQFVDMSN